MRQATTPSLKHLLGLLLGLLLTPLLGSCVMGTLPPGFDDEQVQEGAQAIIQLINREDANGLLAVSSPKMRETLSTDILHKLAVARLKLGEYKEIQTITYQTTQDEEGNPLARATIQARYEAETVEYTIDFDEDMRLAGLILTTSEGKTPEPAP